MKKIKLPNPAIILFSSLGAFWIANIIHLSFTFIGIMILLLIPILIFEFLYSQNKVGVLLEPVPVQLKEEKIIENIPMGELVDN